MTSIDFLVNNIDNFFSDKWDDILAEAKEIHKKEIIEAWNKGFDRKTYNPVTYYNIMFLNNKLNNKL